MISLFIDTSSADVSIAVVKDNKILANITKTIPNEHSIYTTSYLDEIIKKSGIRNEDIDVVMVVDGPGSFTGLRIGITIAKVFAYLLKKEIICISSLKMRALSFKHDYCLSLIDARNNNYYLGLYDKNNDEVIKPVFGNIDMVMEIINEYHPVCVGDKRFSINNDIVLNVELDILNIVKYYKDDKAINPHLVVPNYLKLPQAMENKK